MSGGTWDYRNRLLIPLATDVRDGEGRGGPIDDLPDVRAFAADILDAVADLLQHLDHHFAGDTVIWDEREWVVQAQEKVSGVVRRVALTTCGSEDKS